MNKKYLKVVLALTMLISGCQQALTLDPKAGSPNSLPASITVRGTFAPLEEVSINPPFSSSVLQLAVEGQEVVSGAMIARLAPGDRLDDLHERKLDLDRQTAIFARDKKLVALNAEIEKSSLAIAGLNLQSKQLEYDRAFDSRDWSRLVVLNETARAEAVRAKMLKKQLEAGVAMAARGFVSRQEIVNTRKELDIIAINASLTTQLLPYIEETADEKRVFTAVQNLEKARQQYMVASFSLAKTASDYLLALNSSQREYAQVASSVVELEQEVASLSVSAPCAGMVIHGLTYDGSAFTKVQVGAQVFPGIFFLRIVDPLKTGIQFNVDQRDAPLLATDSPIFFQADAFPERLLAGKVSSVVPMAMEIPDARPGGRTQIAVKVAIASYPVDFTIGYSGSAYCYDFVTEKFRLFAGNRNYKVETRHLKRAVSNTGDVKTASATSLVSEIREGKLNLIADEGKTVKPGDVIAVLGSEELSQSFSDTEIELKKKQEEYDLQLQKNKIDEERLKRSIEVSAGALEVARLKHAAVLKDRDEDKIIDLRRGLELIDGRLALCKEKISHTKELQKKGLSSELDLMKAETELAGLLKDRAINIDKLKTEEAGPTKRSVKLSELEVQRALLELEKTRAEVNLSLYRNLTEVSLHEIAINKLEAALKNYKRQLDSATIKSPSEGAIIHNEFNKPGGGGLGKAKIGDKINRRIPFMQIADLHNLQVHTTVSEMDIKFIRPGDEVKLMLKGNSTRSFPGWVNSKGLVATTDFKKRQDAVVPVIIDLLSPANGVTVIDPAFRPGNTCEVEFKLYDVPQAIFLPFDALLPMATATCVVTPDHKIKPVKVLFSDGLRGCAIESGLTIGEQVLLQEAAGD